MRQDTHSPSHTKHHSHSEEATANISRALSSRIQEVVQGSGVLHALGHFPLQSPNSFCSGFQTPEDIWVSELKHYKTSRNVRTETGLPKTIFLSWDIVFQVYATDILRNTSRRGRAGSAGTCEAFSIMTFSLAPILPYVLQYALMSVLSFNPPVIHCAKDIYRYTN